MQWHRCDAPVGTLFKRKIRVEGESTCSGKTTKQGGGEKNKKKNFIKKGEAIKERCWRWDVKSLKREICFVKEKTDSRRRTRRRRNVSEGRADGMDEETRETFWVEKRHADRVKESVRAQSIKTTCPPEVRTPQRRTHMRATMTSPAPTRGHRALVLQDSCLLPTFSCTRKKNFERVVSAAALLWFFPSQKQINKYSLLLQGHLPSWPVNRTILWKALP